MGNRRVGLSRLEKLMEDMDRTIDLDGSDVTVNSLTADEGVTVSSGGATVTAGGLTVTAGGATVTAGDFTVTAGNSKFGAGLTGSFFANVSPVVGSSEADNGDSIYLSASGGTTHLNINNDHVKAVKLPANHTTVGTRYRIVQGVKLALGGVLRVEAGASNTFSLNSYAVGTGIANRRPGAGANNLCAITGAEGSSGWGAGSYVDIVCVAANEWMLGVHGVPSKGGVQDTSLATMTGSSAVVWSTE